MDESYDQLIEFLEKDIKLNGSRPITTAFLLEALNTVSDEISDMDDDYMISGRDDDW